ncbi:MAG: EAL domain-containing protein, partial [Chitinivibrionales bacterium]|nr:EAL domain-containing protein [Chitinivibrionales bacterium]MBD3358914.1 EAL domain-containing protein [Chitinivibrionales bacterium]
REIGLPPNALELEITESLGMRNAENTIATLTKLKNMGVRLSIDDFGTGYSSLSHLKRFPINTLKVDRSFVMDIGEDPDDEAIVALIIAMAHTLKLIVVAEGVENDKQLAFLTRHHCEEVQGYYFSPPVPAEEFEALLNKQRQPPSADKTKEQ